MKINQILDHLFEYYVKPTSDDDDLIIVINHLNETGSLSYFYYVTKKFEEKLSASDEISSNLFQTILSKWFAECVNELSFVVP